MIRVLHIVGTMNMGGQETFIMNLYRNMNRENIQFDFVVHGEEKGYFEDEILQLGGKIYHITPLSRNPILHMKQLYCLIQENQYQSIHRHTNNAIVCFDIIVAKHAGAKQRIVHSHSNLSNKNKGLHRIFRGMLNHDANVKFACSEQAGLWLFGNHTDFKIIPNAISIEKFTYNSKVRKEMREQYGISEDTLVIGNVAAFRSEKNHAFILSLFSKICAKRDNYILMLCGEGPLREEMEALAVQLHIEDKIIFTGASSEIDKYYQCFDLFLLPSLYEGLGIALIEAQLAGLNCLVSDAIQEEAIITDRVTKLKLEYKDWEKAIFAMNTNTERVILNNTKVAKYDIKTLAKDMTSVYEQTEEL